MNTDKIIKQVQAVKSPLKLSLAAGLSDRTVTNVRAGKLPSLRTLAKLEAGLKKLAAERKKSV